MLPFASQAPERPSQMPGQHVPLSNREPSPMDDGIPQSLCRWGGSMEQSLGYYPDMRRICDSAYFCPTERMGYYGYGDEWRTLHEYSSANLGPVRNQSILQC